MLVFVIFFNFSLSRHEILLYLLAYDDMNVLFKDLEQQISSDYEVHFAQIIHSIKIQPLSVTYLSSFNIVHEVMEKCI